MPPRTRPTAVVSVTRGSRGARPEALLAEALEPPEIHELLGPPNDASRPPRAVVVVAISPPAPVAATVVHELVDLLHERGWDAVEIGAALTPLDRDRGHDQLPAVARLAGLQGTTRRGRAYRLIDLTDDLQTAAVPAASVLEGHEVSAAWMEADLRILLSRNVTDPFDGFSLGLSALQQVAPPLPGADRADVAADLYRYLPAHLSIVDATTSSHGEAGDLVLDPLGDAHGDRRHRRLARRCRCGAAPGSRSGVVPAGRRGPRPGWSARTPADRRRPHAVRRLARGAPAAARDGPGHRRLTRIGPDPGPADDRRRDARPGPEDGPVGARLGHVRAL